MFNTKFSRFYQWIDVKEKFKLKDGEKCIWLIIVKSMLASWVEELKEPTLETRVGKWLNIYNYTLLANLMVVFCIIKEIQPILGAYPQRDVEIPNGIKAYEVGVQFRLLQPMQIKERLSNTLKKVRVMLKKKQLMNYC